MLHIIGTQSNITDPDLIDLVKFTVNAATYVITGPITLVSGSSIRSAYDMVVLNNGIIAGGGTHHKLVAVSVTNPIMPTLFQASITNIEIANSTLTVSTPSNAFNLGQLVTLSGLTTAVFLNGVSVQAITVSPTQFMTVYYYQTLNEAQTVPGNPYQVTVADASQWESNISVVDAATGQVIPASQYTAVAGVYTFTVINVGRNILISYNKFYTSASDTGTVTPQFTGQSLIAFELDDTDSVVANTLKIIANAPERSGNTTGSLSLLTPDDVNVEVYYESHPKLFTYVDQVFSLFLANRSQTLITEAWQVPGSPYQVTVAGAAYWQADGGVKYALGGAPLTNVSPSSPAAAGQYNVVAGFYTFYSADVGANLLISYYENSYTWGSPSLLTTFQGRYTDDRLTALLDGSGNRYLSQIYYTQINHPEGLMGNVILGTQPSGGSWLFFSTLGTVAGGSFVQGSLSLSQTMGVNFIYLLQPFDAVPRTKYGGFLPHPCCNRKYSYYGIYGCVGIL